jgi:hypothetical protein
VAALEGSNIWAAGVVTQAGYRRLWAARTIPQWGDMFNAVALGAADLRPHRLRSGVSGIVVAEIFTVLLLAPLAGPLVDRWPRVRVMSPRTCSESCS